MADDEKQPLNPPSGDSRKAAAAAWRDQQRQEQPQYGATAAAASGGIGSEPPPASYTVPLKSDGVKPNMADTGRYHPEDERLVRGRSGSLHVMSENSDLFFKPQGKSAGHGRAASHGNLAPLQPSGGLQAHHRSYSVSGDGQISYLTPLQMGRAELYEMVPFMAVPGLQKKERNLSRAFASYAAELDVLEVSVLFGYQKQRFDVCVLFTTTSFLYANHFTCVFLYTAAQQIGRPIK